MPDYIVMTLIHSSRRHIIMLETAFPSGDYL